MNIGKIFKSDIKIFLIFLLIHFVLWSLLPLIRDLLPIDAMEEIIWGGLFDFGTHKHPPLSGWLAYGFYNLLGKTDYSLYMLGQIFVIIGFVYLYKLGKIFLQNSLQAILAVMIMEGCVCYSYLSIADGFNPNFMLYASYPMIVYYFYNCLKNDKYKDWIALGILTGLSFIAKYQTLILLIPMIVCVTYIKDYRKVFRNHKFYISVSIAFLIFLPHLIWLFQNDFFSFMYFLESQQRNHMLNEGHLKCITSPLKFLFNQFILSIGCFVIFAFAYFKSNSSKNIVFNKNADKGTASFLLIMGIGPLLTQAFPGLVTGDLIDSTWGYSLQYMYGLMLFYFIPLQITDDLKKFIIKMVYFVMFIIFLVLLILFTVEKNFRSKYPALEISNRLKTIYEQETGKPLKYLDGLIEYIMPVTIYDETHPVSILKTYGHKNPWINEEDVNKSGVMIVSRYENDIKSYAEKYNVPIENLEIKNIPYKIKNKFGSEREYDMFYLIIQ